jgi:hypothetical protein
MIIESALNWIHNVDEHTYNGEVIEYWIIFPLETHWSENKKIIGELGHAFGIVGKNPPSWWWWCGGFDLESFRPKVQEKLNFEWNLTIRKTNWKIETIFGSLLTKGKKDSLYCVEIHCRV